MSGSSSILVGVTIAEVPIFTGFAAAALRRYVQGIALSVRMATEGIEDLVTKYALNSAEDVRRDAIVARLERRAETDHDLLIEVASQFEKHEIWSGNRWETHIRDLHTPRRID